MEKLFYEVVTGNHYDLEEANKHTGDLIKKSVKAKDMPSTELKFIRKHHCGCCLHYGMALFKLMRDAGMEFPFLRKKILKRIRRQTGMLVSTTSRMERSISQILLKQLKLEHSALTRFRWKALSRKMVMYGSLIHMENMVMKNSLAVLWGRLWPHLLVKNKFHRLK